MLQPIPDRIGGVGAKMWKHGNMNSLGLRIDENDEPAPRLTWSPVASEQEILAILDAGPEPGERIEQAFRRKEANLLEALRRLSVGDARELHRRLSLGLTDDPIAQRFGRMIAERRERLLAFLAGARRREAIRCAR
jgi:hypothetical protein